MRNYLKYLIPSLLLLIIWSCKKDEVVISNQTCADERTLAVYQDREAMVIITELNQYCLTVDSTDIAQRNYRLENVLVPTTALPSQFQIAGQHVLLTGRKQSCYGLTTLPNLRNVFGYKLEIDYIKSSQKSP